MNQDVHVRITENFTDNLDQLQAYFDEVDEPQVFVMVVELVFEKIIPNLKQFPKIGVDFLQKVPNSIEALQVYEQIIEKLDNSLGVREYIFGDFSILYVLNVKEIFLISIKHHREMTYDVGG